MILRGRPSFDGHRLVVHIGTHKTGTTTVQEGLAASRSTLAAARITYPSAATKWAGHHPLAWAMGVRHPDADPDLTLDQLATAVREEHAAAGSDVLLLSSEDFCFLSDPAVLAETFPEFEISVVLYLRRQDSLLVADHNQNVRMPRRRFAGDLADFVAAFGLDASPRFDYDALLTPWEDTFGDQLHVRPFERSVAAGIIDDLLGAVGLDHVRLPSQRERVSNRSLDPHCTRILRHVNLLDLEMATHRSIVATLERASEEGLLTRRFGRGLSAADIQTVTRFAAALQASNEAVIARHPTLAGPDALEGMEATAKRWQELDEVPLETLQQHLLAWSLANQ